MHRTIFALVITIYVLWQIKNKYTGGICHVADRIYISDLENSMPSWKLRVLGIKQIISLTEHDKSPETLREYIKMGVQNYQFNISDTPDAPIYKLFSRCYDLMITGVPTLVHCRAGISRSATIVIMYLMRHNGMSLDAAVKHLRQCRPQINPNSGFIRQLKTIDVRS